jgi:hypothetical protein
MVVSTEETYDKTSWIGACIFVTAMIMGYVGMQVAFVRVMTKLYPGESQLSELLMDMKFTPQQASVISILLDRAGFELIANETGLLVKSGYEVHPWADVLRGRCLYLAPGGFYTYGVAGGCPRNYERIAHIIHQIQLINQLRYNSFGFMARMINGTLDGSIDPTIYAWMDYKGI